MNRIYSPGTIMVEYFACCNIVWQIFCTSLMLLHCWELRCTIMLVC